METTESNREFNKVYYPKGAFPHNHNQAVGGRMSGRAREVVYCPHCDSVGYRKGNWPNCELCGGPVLLGDDAEKLKEQYRIFFTRLSNSPSDKVLPNESDVMVTESEIRASLTKLRDTYSNVMTDEELREIQEELNGIEEQLKSMLTSVNG